MNSQFFKKVNTFHKIISIRRLYSTRKLYNILIDISIIKIKNSFYIVQNIVLCYKEHD